MVASFPLSDVVPDSGLSMTTDVLPFFGISYNPTHTAVVNTTLDGTVSLAMWQWYRTGDSNMVMLLIM